MEAADNRQLITLAEEQCLFEFPFLLQWQIVQACNIACGISLERRFESHAPNRYITCTNQRIS
jgi:hypothetical protein